MERSEPGTERVFLDIACLLRAYGASQYLFDGVLDQAGHKFKPLSLIEASKNRLNIAAGTVASLYDSM